MNDPIPGDVWDARDGAPLYVVDRKPRTVQVQRRPPGDSKAEPYWMRLTTFETEACYLIRTVDGLPCVPAAKDSIQRAARRPRH